MAFASYAAQASKPAVETIPNDRAIAGGPIVELLALVRSSSVHCKLAFAGAEEEELLLPPQPEIATIVAAKNPN